MPFKPIFIIAPKINKMLLEIERVRGVLEAIKLQDDWLSDMRRDAFILESEERCQARKIETSQARLSLLSQPLFCLTGRKGRRGVTSSASFIDKRPSDDRYGQSG